MTARARARSALIDALERDSKRACNASETEARTEQSSITVSAPSSVPPLARFLGTNATKDIAPCDHLNALVSLYVHPRDTRARSLARFSGEATRSPSPAAAAAAATLTLTLSVPCARRINRALKLENVLFLHVVLGRAPGRLLLFVKEFAAPQCAQQCVAIEHSALGVCELTLQRPGRDYCCTCNRSSQRHASQTWCHHRPQRRIRADWSRHVLNN